MIPTANKHAFCVDRSGTKRRVIRQQPMSHASASVTTAVATTKMTTVSLRKVTRTLLTTVQPHTSALQRNSKLSLSNSRDTHRRLLRRLYVTLDFCPVVLHPLRNLNFAWQDSYLTAFIFPHLEGFEQKPHLTVVLPSLGWTQKLCARLQPPDLFMNRPAIKFLIPRRAS